MSYTDVNVPAGRRKPRVIPSGEPMVGTNPNAWLYPVPPKGVPEFTPLPEREKVKLDWKPQEETPIDSQYKIGPAGDKFRRKR
jgi:hypothetical protein